MDPTRIGVLIVFLVSPLAPAEELSNRQTGNPAVVSACLKSETYVMGGVVGLGKHAASQLFESIGVQLHWSCHPDAIVIRLAPHVPKHFRKGTLAYSLPFAKQGVRITVFYDRLEPILEEHLAIAGSIFGHVLAHELGHVLERVESHSVAGIMRARWSETDFVSMQHNAFGFTEEDAQWIRGNVAHSP